MKPTLKNHPEYSYRSLLIKFANGEPLSCEETNFLAWHEKELSNAHMDPIRKYYLKRYHQHADEHSFLLPHEIMNKEDIQRLKKRLQMLVAPKKANVQFSMTPAQFEQLKTFSLQELIFYHGNQFLTGAPFYPGGIPHTIFFQWGNLFGVAKYVVIADERALKSNLLMYVEDMEERDMDQCVAEYKHLHQLDLNAEHKEKLAMQMNQPTHTESHTFSPFATPKLTLGKDTSGKKED